MRYKSHIDQAVAIHTHLPIQAVSRVTSIFLDQIAQALLEDGAVNLKNFATLTVVIRNAISVRTQKPMSKVYVRFNKRQDLTRILNQLVEREDTMEKYGVAEREEDLDKEATDEGKCPRCGKDAERHGRVKLCPNCGTEPFEVEQ